jgi:hypothetical protein
VQGAVTRAGAQQQQQQQRPARCRRPLTRAARRRETRHTFGRTALLLSGGGGLGCFHVVRGEAGLAQMLWRCKRKRLVARRGRLALTAAAAYGGHCRTSRPVMEIRQ